ncbi:MAG: hypothetical protein KDC92_17575, partial [Bacteroidetes bacterium]|nr:hypothetical protein [Bacteroidota bacterium]
WNTSWWAYSRSGETFPPKGVVALEVGDYNPLLGMSYNSIASLSRSTHRSQGFGSTIARGEETEYFEHLTGDSAAKDVFENVDFTWFRFGDYKLAKKIESEIEKILSKFNDADPSLSVKSLLELKATINDAENADWKARKQAEIDKIITHCLGLWVSFNPVDFYACHGDTATFILKALNRSSVPVIAKNISYLDETRTLDDTKLELNKNTELLVLKKFIDVKIPLTQPYWLNAEHGPALFNFKDPLSIGALDIQPTKTAKVLFEVEGELVQIEIPVEYVWRNGAKGELRRPFEIRARVSSNFEHPVFLFTQEKTQEVVITTTTQIKGIKVRLEPQLPKGWEVIPAFINYQSTFAGQKQKFTFKVTPSKNAQSGEIKAIAIEQGFEHNRSLVEIEYEHIPSQIVQAEAKSKLVFEPISISNKKIGYLQGAGDDVSTALAAIGYDVTELIESNIDESSFAEFDVVILGIRTFNTIDNMPNIYQYLLKYCEQGGKVIVQYNTSRGVLTDEIGPYGLTLSSDRITDETAEMKILEPQHPMFNRPNKITQKDFEGWVQERGLYFPHEWPKEYTAMLESADPGEESLKGALVVANYGKGKYIYTG